ncbi:MAG: hypothetical protein KAT48_04435 [Bacteroidales bacterium]|nr:hypothetical protein [Bacteroidales bacterium]
MLGVAFIMAGIGLLIALATPFLDLGGIHIFSFSFITHSELPAIKYLMLIFNSTQELSLALVGILLIIGIPVIMLIFAGIKLLFGLKSTKPIGIIALVLWIIGVVMCGLIALQIGRDFKHKATTRKEITHQFKTDTPLYLLAGNSEYFDDLIYYEDDFFFDEDHPFIMNEKKEVLIKSIGLDLRKSTDEKTYIILYASARGKNKHHAREISQKIIYHISKTDTSIVFDPYFVLPQHEKWRDQAVHIVLEVPVGQEIYVHPELSTIINYYSYRHSSNRAEKKWQMTEEGLQPESLDDL